MDDHNKTDNSSSEPIITEPQVVSSPVDSADNQIIQEQVEGLETVEASNETNPSFQKNETVKHPLVAIEQSPNLLTKFLNLLKSQILLLPLIIIFFYGMTVPQTEAGVNQVLPPFLILGAAVTLFYCIKNVRKVLQTVNKTQVSSSEIMNKTFSFLVISVLISLVIPYLFFIPVLYLIFFLRVSKSHKTYSKVPIFIKVLTVLLALGVSLVSYGLLVIIGGFMLSLRACELSSSKCF
jgi:hypothetical protein